MKFRQTKHHQLQSRQSKKHSKSPQRKVTRWLMGGALLTAALSGGKFPLLVQAARADVYHAVEPGDTLGAVAAHYGLRAAALRAANHLDAIRDNALLPAMLLRIPDGKNGSAPEQPALTSNVSSNAPATTPAINSSGTIAQSVRYTVQAGDTLESIARRYTQSGYPVTVEAIAQKNRLTPEPNTQPPIGSAIIVPLQSVNYRVSAQQSASRHSKATPRNTDSDITVSQEVPMAQVVPDKQPVYQSITTPPQSAWAARRGMMLGSRGMPVGGREGVRVLKQNEDALNTSPQPQRAPRVIQAPAFNGLAQVAKVVANGASIRRLPEASAYTLYHCAVGTELAVTRQSGSWSAVLMSDRSTGWIPSRYLKLTGTQVDITSQVITGNAAWEGRPDNEVTSYNGHYASNNPMVSQALLWLGTPYVYGGEGRRGIDCSSLVQHAFAACGYRLPRTAAEQARVGQTVDPAYLQAGDRLYFSASGTRIDHTGLYMGSGLFVEASGSGRAVIVSNLFSPRKWNLYVCARR